MRLKEDETIQTNADKNRRRFGRQNKKSGNLAALEQFCKSEISDTIFNIFKKEMNNNGKILIYDTIEKTLKYIR